MNTLQTTELNTRYTGLSDRFRSLWTFYQFLGGVFKYQDKGKLPLHLDFQALYKRVQALLPMIGDGTNADVQTIKEIELLEREIGRIHGDMVGLEREFPPSLLRRFFDRLKNQDEKILFALVKFYLLNSSPDKDTFDKLDILLTRLAEVPSESGPIQTRDLTELKRSFSSLAEMAKVPRVPPGEERTLIHLIRDLRSEVGAAVDFDGFLESKIVDRFRELKERLGVTALHPAILVEVVNTNIVIKNRFKALYLEEEVRILEDTNRIFEIERYVDRNPGIAHEDLGRQLDTFRVSRERYDAGRRDQNIKREDIADLRQSMQAVLAAFEPGRGGSVTKAPIVAKAPEPFFRQPVQEKPVESPKGRVSVTDSQSASVVDSESEVFQSMPVFPSPGPFGPPTDLPSDSDLSPEAEAEDQVMDPGEEEPGLLDLLPPDPLLMTALHKIVFALELVVWDHPPEQASKAKELHHLRLEPWEVGTYRFLMEQRNQKGAFSWDLHVFLLTSAALRIKMEEEKSEIVRLGEAGKVERQVELLECSAQSLERAREVDRRFRWFIDDMLFKGDTERLEQIYRSHFRFLFAFSGLWLQQQTSGGMTPL
ncbi:MAG: hypothetical protein K8R59_08275 [Thermoanaerobaculales bacterium]|nr:hypothetical protein [Thermoanaerobaculales bacterium]